MSNYDYFRELEKNLATFSEVGESTRRQVAIAFASLSSQLSEQISILNRANFSIRLPDIYSAVSAIDTSSLFKALEMSTNIVEIVKPITVWNDILTEQVRSMTEGIAVLTRRITADFAAINLSMLNMASSGIFDKLISLVEFNTDASEAFNAAGWPISPSMPLELREHIVLLHRQNKTRYISRAIMGYYHRNNYKNLNEVIETWENHPLFALRMHIIKDALKAHTNGSYTLSVPTIMPQIEGILNDYVRVNNLSARFGKIKDVYNAVIGDLDEYPLSNWAIANTLLHQLQTNTYAYTDFEAELKRSTRNRRTTRHTVLHGITINYDKPIHSLKAFLLLDALSALQEFDFDNPV